jgi:simple sugar transport system substrate-binding protein
MKKTKILAILLAMLMVVGLIAACGTSTSKKTDAPATTEAPKEKETEAAADEPKEEADEPKEEAEEPEEKEEEASDGKVFKIVMVAKHEGIPWFDDMRRGVEDFGKDYADEVEAWQIAPEGGDPAKQVQMVEDLIAQKVDAILVVPNDPNSMRPVLERAKSQGIVVISHEAAGIADVVDYDLEAFSNEEFGETMFEALAEAMGGEGEYAMMVGGLTMETHMDWMNAGKAYVEEKYPNMKAVADQPFEDQNDDKVSRDKAIEILNAYPDLKGYVSASVSGGSNMASVLKERENKDIMVVSLGLPSVSMPYIDDGYMYQAQTWRPADAGYASAALAYNILKGVEIKDGMDLGRDGYESITIKDKIVYGNAPMILKKGMFEDGDYPF